MRPVDGRFFGSFHGGHSNETVTSFVDGEEIDTSVALTFKYGRELNVVSESTLNSDAAEYNVKLSMIAGQGFEHTILNVESANTVSERMREMFTCMTITNKRFDKVIRPETFTVSTTVGDEKVLQNSGSVTQYDSTRKHRIRTDFTTFNMKNASKTGPYIQARDGDNKLYYNSSEDGAVFSKLTTEIIRYFDTV